MTSGYALLERVNKQMLSLLVATWPLHDIAITNILWCMAYKRGFGGGGVYCAMVVQQYCSSARAMQVGGGNKRMVDLCPKASK